MTKNFIFKNGCVRVLAALLPAVLLLLTGCQTPQPKPATVADMGHSESIILREGDVLKISFPSSPNLDTTQQIRRDGKISLSLVGEVEAAGKTPDELQAKLIELYAPQISSKEVTVTVASSSFPVFITGCVMRPGKITSDHPMTVLEGIMEAGGFDYTRANIKSVRVIRRENGASESHKLNLQPDLEGKNSNPFYLQPSDIVYVPEKLSLF
jgi:polysaccharide export outer membrane protein